MRTQTQIIVFLPFFFANCSREHDTYPKVPLVMALSESY